MSIQGEQQLFVGIDGTLAVFNRVKTLEDLYEQGYFLNLPPHGNVIAAIKHIVKTEPRIQVGILSAMLMDSDHAFEEKSTWLDRHLPEVTCEQRLITSCGGDKKERVRGGIAKEDFLLDDYTPNILHWGSLAAGLISLMESTIRAGSGRETASASTNAPLNSRATSSIPWRGETVSSISARETIRKQHAALQRILRVRSPRETGALIITRTMGGSTDTNTHEQGVRH
ncbi:MAG: hypothetical protein KGZ64_11360 [Thermaerobacter sp.]|nr:hypothetical protein [Thermaerobacter sp.]